MSDPNDPIKRIRVHPENKNSPANSRELVPLAATDYDTLLARHFADLKPGNVVEQKHVEAMVYDMAGELELRRAMTQVIHDARAAALASALSDLIDPPLVSDDELMEKIAKYEAELARGEAGLRLSGRTQVNTGAIQCALEQAKSKLEARRAAALQAQVDKLMHGYHKGDPAVKRITEVLAKWPDN